MSSATNIEGPDHDARRLIRAYDIRSVIRYLFADDVTYLDTQDIKSATLCM